MFKKNPEIHSVEGIVGIDFEYLLPLVESVSVNGCVMCYI